MKIFLVITLLFTQLSYSQDTKKGVRYFTLAVFEKVIDQQVYYRDGEELIPIKFKTGRRSEIYKLKGDHGLELFVKEMDSEGKPTNKLIGKPRREVGYKNSLFLIDKSSKKGELRVFESNDGITDFPAGSFRFLNLTTQKIGIKLDGSPKVIKAGGTLTFPVKDPKNKSFVSMSLYSTRGDLLVGSRMYCQATAREFIIIYPPRHGKQKIKLNYLNQLLPKNE